MTIVTQAHVITAVAVFLLHLWLCGNVLEAIEAVIDTMIEWLILDTIVVALTIVAFCR